MVGALLLRGMLVGIVAGLIAFAFARAYGEPHIDMAIALEEQLSQATTDHQHGADSSHSQAEAFHHGEEAPVSRETQAGIGLFTAIVVYSAALGGLLALAFSFAYGRVSILGPRALAALITTAGFLSLELVPFLKYPANPPAVGNPDTITDRTALFFLAMLISVIAMAVAIWLAKHFWAQLGAWNASLIGGCAFIVVIAAANHALPDVNEVPAGFPATLLWQFRLTSLSLQLLLWALIGLGFGYAAERYLKERSAAFRLA